MTTIRATVGLAVAALAAATFSAHADDKPLQVTIDNYATYDDTSTLFTNHELTFKLEGKAGDWTLGAKAWVGIMGEFPASTWTFEDPTLKLYAKSDALGELDLWNVSSALGNACITAPGGSTHFGSEALLTFGTCGGYGGQGFTYISPDFFDGFGLQVSAVKDLKNATLPGDVDTGVSAALTYSHTNDSDVSIDASLGIDAAVGLNGGVPPGTVLPVTIQSGINVGWDGWTVGAAGQYEFASLTGGNSWGAGAGVSKAVTDQVTLGAEVSADGYEGAGVKYQELSLGSTAEFTFLDNASIDGAFNVVRRTGDDGSDVTGWQIGTGLSVWF